MIKKSFHSKTPAPKQQQTPEMQLRDVLLSIISQRRKYHQVKQAAGKKLTAEDIADSSTCNVLFKWLDRVTHPAPKPMMTWYNQNQVLIEGIMTGPKRDHYKRLIKSITDKIYYI